MSDPFESSPGSALPPPSRTNLPPPPAVAASHAQPTQWTAGGQSSPSYASGLPSGVHAASPWLRLGAYVLESILILVTLYIGWIIWALMIGGEGQTPAKKLLGMRVIGADTLQPVGLGKMFWVRGLLAGIVAPFAILLTVGILLFMPFWDKRNQNIWDKVSNTYVVTDPNNAWSRKPDLRG